MSRMPVPTALVCGLLILSACAESAHQVLRDAERLGVPPELVKEIDTSVSFADLQKAPGEYMGRTVLIGGIVIRAKRTRSGTELEVLQLPTEKEGTLAENRIRSEGRFLAVREEFLDPASVPAGTPITVIGTMKGVTTRQLDESGYTYPLLEVKHIIDWNSIATQRPRDYYDGPYYPPYGWGWFYPYSNYGGYWGWPGFYRPFPYFIPRSSPSPPPPPPRSVPPNLRRR